MSTINTTPYETPEEALEARIRFLGYYMGPIQASAAALQTVRDQIALMEEAGFPTELKLLDELKALEQQATFTAEKTIIALVGNYQRLVEETNNPPQDDPPAE